MTLRSDVPVLVGFQLLVVISTSCLPPDMSRVMSGGKLEVHITTSLATTSHDSRHQRMTARAKRI
jgi:hypothetical protein